MFTVMWSCWSIPSRFYINLRIKLSICWSLFSDFVKLILSSQQLGPVFTFMWSCWNIPLRFYINLRINLSICWSLFSKLLSLDLGIKRHNSMWINTTPLFTVKILHQYIHTHSGICTVSVNQNTLTKYLSNHDYSIRDWFKALHSGIEPEIMLLRNKILNNITKSAATEGFST